MKISIIVPAYNEENTLEEVMKKLLKIDFGIQKEIIAVNDGSIDNTAKILNSFRKKGVKVFHHEKNKGKGAAIRTGISNATGDIITIQDSDLEYTPENLKYLIKPIIDGKEKVVYGSRFMKKNKVIYSSYYLGNKIVSLFASLIYLRKVSDVETCYKVFSSDVIKDIHLNARGFEFEPEVTAKILKKGIRIFEMPIDYKPRTKEEGKKIRPKDGIIALWTLIKYRF